MSDEQYSSHEESIALCNKLINQLKDDQNRMKQCIHGDLLKTYEKATEKAINEVERIRRDLKRIQSMQQ